LSSPPCVLGGDVSAELPLFEVAPSISCRLLTWLLFQFFLLSLLLTNSLLLSLLHMCSPGYSS
jgi:hypothetical protein